MPISLLWIQRDGAPCILGQPHPLGASFIRKRLIPENCCATPPTMFYPTPHPAIRADGGAAQTVRRQGRGGESLSVFVEAVAVRAVAQFRVYLVLFVRADCPRGAMYFHSAVSEAAVVRWRKLTPRGTCDQKSAGARRRQVREEPLRPLSDQQMLDSNRVASNDRSSREPSPARRDLARQT